jgi:hypothetical protein
MHDPSDIAAAKRAAGRRLGGQTRMKPRPSLRVADLPPAEEITSLDALSKVLSKALQGVLTGRVDSKTAHAAAALAGPLLKTLAMAEGVEDETDNLRRQLESARAEARALLQGAVCPAMMSEEDQARLERIRAQSAAEQAHKPRDAGKA